MTPMHSHQRLFRLFAAAVLLACAAAQAADYTALDRYVAAPDPSFRYTLNRTLNYPGMTVYQLDLVSQTWLTTAEVDRPEWHHWVTIYKPDTPSTSSVLLLIDGGSNTPAPPSPDPQMVLLTALAGGVVVDLGQVPNEPLTFAGETKPRSEDAIIAYTWDKFLRTGDERWPARLPMTKAAVRAMDAVTAFLGQLPTGPVTVKNFVVMGASKRGWTTWSTAAVDPRVVAIGPIVFDSLNLAEAFQHHWEAYGAWSTAVQDYVDAGIMNWFGSPQMDALLAIEDPYNYRGRLALPNYQVASTGDQFFVPDSPRFYLNDMPGEKYLRFVPNTDHSAVIVAAAAPNLVTWFQAVTSNYPRPRFYWTADRAGGNLTVRTVDAPNKVLLWQATNPKGRDFRLETIGAVWTSTPLTGANGIYSAPLPSPVQGWTAYMVELDFPGPGGGQLVFTTEVVVMPDIYPFPSPFAAPERLKRGR
ncbi:MAG: PhoPQ-activated pathogenicity-related family protein [Acidobacteriota bacterium]|nr:PhoPQ-activated pathogenicity-related family protein [Acidobacteriota bacterium]